MSHGKPHIADCGDPVRHDAAAWFARLRADNVDERERSEFQRWLSADPGHQTAYRRLEVLWSRMGDHAGRPEINDALHESEQMQRRSSASTARRHRRSVWGWSAVAAVLLIALAGGWFGWVTQKTVVHTYATGVGEKHTWVLEDGSQVTMDTNTRLTTSFSAKARRLTLEQGRAFFHVAKDPKRPFLVTARGGVIRATGTKFDVYEHHNAVEVTLVEGSVTVTPKAEDSGARAEPTTMSAGQRLLMGKAYPKPVLESVDTGTAIAWLSGKIIFNDTPVPAAVAQFNRYSTSKIIIGDAAISRLHVSGVFRNDNSHAFVKALHTSYGVSAVQDAKGNLTLLSGTASQNHPLH